MGLRLGLLVAAMSDPQYLSLYCSCSNSLKEDVCIKNLFDGSIHLHVSQLSTYARHNIRLNLDANLRFIRGNLQALPLFGLTLFIECCYNPNIVFGGLPNNTQLSGCIITDRPAKGPLPSSGITTNLLLIFQNF